MRVYKPHNPTIVKGALRNLLDGSRANSIDKFVDEIEQVYTDYIAEDDCYIRDSFLQLLEGNYLILYCHDRYFFTQGQVDFIIINGTRVRGYNAAEEKESFHLDKFQSSSQTIRELIADLALDLDGRIGSNVVASTIVLAWDSYGNMLIPDDMIDHLREPDSYKPVNQEVNKPVNQEINKTQEKTEITEMSKTTKVINANKTAVVNAAKIEAGNIALQQITKLVASKAPLMVRGYVDTPVGRVVLANLLNVAIEQYAPNNQKAKIIAEAAMNAAMLEMVQSFNVAGLINDMVDCIEIPNLEFGVE